MTKEESIKEYYFRINRSIDFIKANLHNELSLEILACQANFSKFHFHRIFKSVTGSALNEFIVQSRIERSLFYLVNHPSKSISSIALECGFSDTSAFSRCFKEVKKVSATQWRAVYHNSKICKEESKTGNEPLTVENYLAHKLNQMEMMNTSKEKELNIKVLELPELHVAYVRNLDVHIHDSATFAKMFDLLFHWAVPKGLINFPHTQALTVYRSNANLSGRVQADVCLTVPENTAGEGLIGTTTISGGLYAVVHKEASLEECFTTWDYIFEVWFEQNGYQPDHRNFYINHLNDAKTHPQNLHIFDMCIPVKPL
ncbi:AraC family transcriptional regulator [Paracnuella aquatica]|uniref:AraC family transcriptional regulator n=1 Tax=Paracnuella aquatica TaxID=2268757 RepID=UPI000DEFE29D|nr:AraC family transcriptional regulator [Paracnuella aquatica]RPD46075.1 AraC family transcriptional regulator [Paracnuella aquatica]